MVVTIIPYFLLASISDKSVWLNGPEFKFDSNVEIDICDSNETKQVSRFDITSEYSCRPKTDFSLQCQYQHKKLFTYENNTETNKITQTHEMSFLNSSVFEPFFFEIGFDKKGVNKIILNETLSKNEVILDKAKAMANALNVGTDLSKVKLSVDPVEFEQVKNIILGKCKGNVTVNFTPSEGDISTDADWNLELSPPLEKLAGRNLNTMKTWNLTDCKTVNTFFWFGVIVAIDNEDRPPRDDVDVTVNMVKINDRIAVSRGNLDYQSVIDTKVIVKKKLTSREIKLNVHEFSKIRLSGIQPAIETWPEIENAITINLYDQK